MKLGALLSVLVLSILTANPVFAGSIRISGAQVIDDGNASQESSTPIIDVIQGTCGSGEEITAEPFFDTLLNITVNNQSSERVRFTRFKYKVLKVDGGRASFTSRSLSVSGTEIDTEASGTILTLFADARSGGKHFWNRSSAITSNSGFKNVELHLYGRSVTGRNIHLTARLAMSFDNYDRCE